jgi:hypothetical protein
MLMGFPLDYWETYYIQDAICSFGRVENWVNNRRRLTRLIVRARVVDLQSIPQWIIYTDGPGNDLDSWTIQCEIISHDFVGGGPPPKDPAPQHYDHLAPFDFFGLGQPGAGPVEDGNQNDHQLQAGVGNQNNQQLQADNQNNHQLQAGMGNIGHFQGQGQALQDFVQDHGQGEEDFQEDDENQDEEEINPNAQWDLLVAQNAPPVAWGEWPAPQNQQPIPGQNEVSMEIDLNNILENPDMQEVIIHPAIATDTINGGFVHEANEVAIQNFGQNLGLDLNDPPKNQANGNDVDQAQANEEVDFPHLNFPIQPLIDEEILHDLLMNDLDDFDQEMPENNQLDEAADNVLNVGTVIIRDEHLADPVFLQRQLAVRTDHKAFWLTAFNSIPGMEVKVETNWAPFFASMVLSPRNHKWAKNFINSDAWSFFSNSLNSIFIKVPEFYPKQKARCVISDCSSQVQSFDLEVTDANSAALTPAKKVI